MRSVKKGGSKASDLVMSTNPVLCENESPVMLGKPIEANINDFTLYATTGGGKSCCSQSKMQVGAGSCGAHNDEAKKRQVGAGSCGAHNDEAKKRQIGGKRRNKSKKNKSKRNKSRKNKSKKNKSKRNKSRRNKRGGSKSIGHAGVESNCMPISNQSGGSDWRSTVYSRGSYIAPDMPVNQFRAFTKSAEYMPNSSMRSASFMK